MTFSYCIQSPKGTSQYQNYNNGPNSQLMFAYVAPTHFVPTYSREPCTLAL